MRTQVLPVRTDSFDRIVAELSMHDEHAPEVVPATRATDIVDVWGEDSFPASDPPANW